MSYIGHQFTHSLIYLQTPKLSWSRTFFPRAQREDRAHEIGQVGSVLLLVPLVLHRQKHVGSGMAYMIQRQFPEEESWDGAVRTLSSWGGVIYDFSQANKEEKWGKKKAVLYTLRQERENSCETREREVPICAHGRPQRPRHTHTHTHIVLTK